VVPGRGRRARLRGPEPPRDHPALNAFDWLEADRLAACANPAYGDAVVSRLRAEHIQLLINLHEQPDRPELGIDSVHLPVADFTAPTQAQLEAGVAAIAQALARGQRVAVHCGAGLGRTGTLLACYLVSALGLSAKEAIHRVRVARPRSIETEEQEQAIRRYATRLAGLG
jgi:atypical dual specificity phosphatase